MADEPGPLQTYTVERGRHSVSGLSSGAFMAVQLHLAHSACFAGAGIVAGGPYRCAESFRAAAVLAQDAYTLNSAYICMSPLTGRTAPDPARSIRLVREVEQDALIDPIAGLADQRVYVFTGTNDRVVHSSVVTATRDFYEGLYRDLGVTGARLQQQLLFVGHEPAGHAILTDNHWDQDIAENQPPYINSSAVDGHAGYMQSHRILDHIYSAQGARQPAESLSGTVHSFDQGQFTRGYGNRAGMDDVGFVYVPAEVAAGKPARGVHICLHGCKQGYNFVDYVNGRRDRANRIPYGRRYVISTGYNAWADANDLIVLYPQVEARDDNDIQNPDGCWDWWGYSSQDGQPVDYFTRKAAQIEVLHAMLTRLCGGDPAQ